MDKGFITANTILDSMGDEQKTKEIYLNESSPDSTYWIYKDAKDENTRKSKILEILAQEENKEKIFSKIIINDETIDIIFSNTNENIHSKLALELTEYMNNEWFKDIFICFKEMWKVISDDTKSDIADTIMKKYFGKQFVLLMFDDRMISENKDYINKLIKYWMDSEQKSITEIMLFRLNTELTKVIWKSFDKEMQLSIIYDILHNCIRYSEYGLFWEIWDVSNAEIQKETICNLTKILMKEIMISEGEFRTRELCEIICGMWKSADKNVMDSELSNLIELVSSNNEAFYHILLRCFSDLDEKQYNIIMEKVKNNPEKLDIFIYFVSETNYGQTILIKEKQSDNYYEKEFIKAVIYYLLAMQIESLEDGLEKFSQGDGKEWCNSIIETMPKYHPARICYNNISLEDRDFDKMKSVALVKIAMYQMIREHESLKNINSEADVDSLVEYISNGYNESNVSSQIKLYKNILEKNKDKLELYLRIFEKYCDNDEYKKIVNCLNNESNETNVEKENNKDVKTLYKLCCLNDRNVNSTRGRLFEEMYDGDFFTGECEIELKFFNKVIRVTLNVQSEDGSPTQYQKDTLDSFMNNFETIQVKVVEKIVEYYNEHQKFSYGPDDKEELNKIWPEINSVNEMLEHLEFSMIIIRDEHLYNDGTVFLGFFYDYGDDTEGDGIEIKITEGEIKDIGYISMAF